MAPGEAVLALTTLAAAAITTVFSTLKVVVGQTVGVGVAGAMAAFPGLTSASGSAHKGAFAFLTFTLGKEGALGGGGAATRGLGGDQPFRAAPDTTRCGKRIQLKIVVAGAHFALVVAKLTRLTVKVGGAV